MDVTHDGDGIIESEEIRLGTCIEIEVTEDFGGHFDDLDKIRSSYFALLLQISPQESPIDLPILKYFIACDWSMGREGQVFYYSRVAGVFEKIKFHL